MRPPIRALRDRLGLRPRCILLLEQRYPPGTPGKYHFPLSAAVKFLKQGGKVGGLDFLWASGA